jgi:hypothetical protein
MSGFFSANVTSPFPDQNALFDAAKVANAGQAYQSNQLHLQGQQMDLTAADHEQVARLSAALLNEPDLGKRADLYSRGVGMLQSQNLAKYAPPTLPDESTLRMLAAQGVSSEKQYEYGAGRSAAQGALGALGIGSTGTGTGTTGAAPAGSVATAPSGTIEPAAFNNATAVRDGLIKRGMDPDTATGAAANALHESVANPRTGRGDKGNAAGIFMWTGPRLQAYIDKTGHPPDGAPLDEQLDFLMSEWNGSEADAAAKVAEAKGPAAKAAAFSQYFLRPKDTQGEMQRRSATALQLQQQIGGGATTASTAPTGGVAARTGGTDTAGPGAGPVAPPGPTATPGGDLMGPRALPSIGPGSPVVTPQSLANTPVPQNGLAPPPSAQAPTPAQPGQPAQPQAAPTPAPAPVAPQVPLEPLLDLKPSGLTAQQEAAAKNDLSRQGLTPAAVTAITAHYQQLAASNVTANQSIRSANRQAQNDAQAQQEKALADTRAAETQRLAQITSQREQEAAQRDTERLALQKKQAEQGSTQNSRDDYTLRTEDPSSQQYADAYVRQKWTIAPNGNVIETDISRYPAPNRNIQRPTFLPAPTPQGLDEVRKADTDAKVITSAIDHYTDVFEATGGGGWDAYFANPTDPKTQQLLGAFDRMKTVLRSPQYYNTGVLQPAEIKLMGEDLVSPQSLRGVFATPQALATRLGEIKLAVLTRQDAELRSVGKDGVIVRDKADYAKVPDGGRYYDEEGHLKIKSGKQ